MRLGLVAALALLVLAGCGGFVESPDAPSATDTDTATPTDPGTDTTSERTATPGRVTPTPTATESDAPVATSTPVPDGAVTDTPDLSADNPWDRTVVPVVVDDRVNDGRNATAIAERALGYWNAHMSRYTPYSFRFRLTDDADDARIEVRFVDDIESCDGPATHTVGCARWLQPDEEPRDTEVARVVSNHSNSAVTGTTKHELGHLLSLDHGDDPAFLMAQNSTDPVRNAGDRPNPWYAETLSVGVDHDSLAGDRETVDAQVGRALAFYEAGANGTVPGNVTFERTDRRHAADVVVTNDSSCDVEGGSAMTLQGQNYDEDDALEVHTRATICVDVDAEAVGWHVGSWLGPAFGLERDELAPEFRNASYEDTHGNWWA